MEPNEERVIEAADKVTEYFNNQSEILDRLTWNGKLVVYELMNAVFDMRLRREPVEETV